MERTLFNIDENVWKNAAKEFGRTEETLNEDVETIKNWFKTQPHLPELMEDIKIKNFLLLNKCSVEKSKQKIDMYYTIRSLIPDFYEDCNPKLPNMKSSMEFMYFFLLPKLHEGLYRIFFHKTTEMNRLCPKELCMQLANVNEVRLHEDCMVGDIFLVDCKNFTLNDFLKVTLPLLVKMLAIYQKVYSLRIKAIYYLNSPSYIDKLISVLKVVMKPKIFERVQVHKDDKILSKILAKEDLPKDYGGDGPSLQELQEMMDIKLSEYQPRFDDLDKLRVSETLRPEKLNNDEILGFYGNFKKLNVD